MLAGTEQDAKDENGARIGYTMLFVIATKLDVFLQLTPEMQTHLPQPLNRISIGIRMPGRFEDCAVRTRGCRLQKCKCTSCCLCLPLMTPVCVSMCGWQGAVVAHERVGKAKVLFSFSRNTRKSSHSLTLELRVGGRRRLTQSGHPIFLAKQLFTFSLYQYPKTNIPAECIN